MWFVSVQNQIIGVHLNKVMSDFCKTTVTVIMILMSALKTTPLFSGHLINVLCSVIFYSVCIVTGLYDHVLLDLILWLRNTSTSRPSASNWVGGNFVEPVRGLPAKMLPPGLGAAILTNS